MMESATPSSAPISGPRVAAGGGLPLLWVFAGLFVLSGAAGLIYEVVWSRLLVHVFGVTAFAVSTVLVSFMGGMALGAALLGRRADRSARPLRMFALLEAGIGLYAFLLPWLLHGVDLIYASLIPALPDSFLLRSSVRFVFCLGLLLVPTVLMGGTLPALGRGLLRREERLGGGVGLLYFVNTLGAALGCYLAGFHLIPHLGLFRTTLVAAGLNGTVALTAFVLDRRAGAREESQPLNQMDSGEGADRGSSATTPGAAARDHGGVAPWWPLAVAFGSGMAALAFEVAWFRVLVLVFGSTVYSFSAMLSVFLLGLAAGALVVGVLADRFASPVRLLVLTQGAVAVLVFAGLLAVGGMPEVFLRLLRHFGLTFEGMNRTKLLLSFVTLIGPAMAFGATFPVAVRLVRRRGGETGTGSRIGRVYAWNTLGAIVGSFGAGFLLLPWIGAEWTLRLVVVVALLLAFGSVLAERGPLRPGWAFPVGFLLVAVAAGLVLAPSWDRTVLGAGIYFEPRQFFDARGRVNITRVVADYELMTYTEGYNDTIISFRSPKGKFITVNGSPTASDQFEDMFSQRMLGHLPMALHPGPVRRACIIGLGAGVTAGAIGLYEVDELVAVELEKGVFVASRFFEEENHHVLDNPVVRIRIDDGRNYLKLTEGRFDVISSAPNFPSLTGSGALYSREFFELCRRRLAPGGVMCQFAPLWRLLPEDVRTIVGSFTDVFPRVRVFNTGLSLVMLGREERFPPVDLDEVQRRVSREGVRESLAGIGVGDALDLLSYYRFDEDEARAWSSGAPRNTDDMPRIEFFAPRALFTGTVAMNLEQIRRFVPTPEARARRLGLPEETRDAFAERARAYDAVTDAEVAFSKGLVDEALSLAAPAARAGQRYGRYILADHYEKVGLALQARNDLEGAFQAFQAALEYEPDRLDAMMGAGYVAIFLGRLDEAERWLTRAVNRYPRSGAAWARLGIVRELQGRRDEAEAYYRRAVELQPLLAKPHALLGHALLFRGQVAEAVAHLERAVALGDEAEGTWLGLVDARLRLGDAREALRVAQEAVARFPGSADAYRVLLAAAEAAGDAREAARARAVLQSLGTVPDPRPQAP